MPPLAAPTPSAACTPNSSWDQASTSTTAVECQRVGDWAAANNVEIAYTPTNSSWLNRIEAQFSTLRYFALDGTDHATHRNRAA